MKTKTSKVEEPVLETEPVFSVNQDFVLKILNQLIWLNDKVMGQEELIKQLRAQLNERAS